MPTASWKSPVTTPSTTTVVPSSGLASPLPWMPGTAVNAGGPGGVPPQSAVGSPKVWSLFAAANVDGAAGAHVKASAVVPSPVNCSDSPTAVPEPSLTPTSTLVSPAAGPSVAISVPS